MSSPNIFYIWVVMIFSSSLCRTQVASISLGSGLPDIRMLRSCQIHSIYQLGDSISDTGNSKIENPLQGCDQLPYGISFLQEPTGRCSDGLLMIDHIASAAGIPLLNPYLKSNANFTNGVNFAVGGSTALSANALAKRNIRLPSTNSSLGVQLEWMSTYFASQCNIAIDCSPGSMKHALFMVGEIGGNDYNFALLQGKTVAEAQNMVPEVVEIIIYAIRRVIGFGATRVIVPGNFPIGCFPGFLAPFISNNESSYDEDQCLREMNKVAEFHNEYLQQEVDKLQEENPTTTIVYADYYNAFKWLLHNAPHLGIDATSILKSCCGEGGKYSFSPTDRCGRPNVPACSNPDEYISWDGVHLTQKAYSVLAQWLVADITPKLNCINLQDQ